jgi:hypothetical protein
MGDPFGRYRIFTVYMFVRMCRRKCVYTSNNCENKILDLIFIKFISNFRQAQLVDNRLQLLISWYSLYLKGELITVSLFTHRTRVFSRGLFLMEQVETHNISHTFQHFSWNLQFSGATELCQNVYCRQLPHMAICAVLYALPCRRCL